MVTAAVDNNNKNNEHKISPVEFLDNSADPQEDQNLKHTVIRGRWDQYRSPFWSLAVAAIGTRYGARPFTRHLWNPEQRFMKHLRQEKAAAAPAESYIEKPWDYHKKYIYAGVAGTVMTAATGYYASQTYRDMKNIFAETVAWELDKKPEDVSFNDLRKSNNIIVQRTMHNFIKYNLRRTALDAIFFLPLIPGVGKFLFKKNSFIEKLGATEFHHAETPLDIGVASTSAYLLTDVVGRKISFFEELQAFADRKINHTDMIGDKITAEDLISLYDRHARDLSPKYTVSGRMDTSRWRSYQVLFGRVADLMNETYGNTINTEHADFTVPKLIFLLGQGLIRPEKMEESLALIELASHRNSMPYVKDMATLIKEGMSVEAIAKSHPEFAQACELAKTRFANALDKEKEIALLRSKPALQHEENEPSFVERVAATKNPIDLHTSLSQGSHIGRLTAKTIENARSENSPGIA